jgi:hypothetical protein
MGPGLRREDEQRVVGTSEAVIATRNVPPASESVSAKSAVAADAASPRCTNLAAVIAKSPCCMPSRPYSDFTDPWQTAR